MVALATAILGFLGTTGWWRLRMSGRLRANIADEVAILNQLPEGEAHDALGEHIERRVLLLIAEQEGMTSSERLNVRWAWAWIGVGLLLPILVIWGTQLAMSSWPARLLTWAGVALAGFGVYSLMRLRDQHQQRKWEKRREAEVRFRTTGRSSRADGD